MDLDPDSVALEPKNKALQTWHWHEPIDVLREVLDAGGVLAIPTESSYGLAVDPRNHRGVTTILDIKGRPAEKALPIVAADSEQLVDLGVAANTPELTIASSFWPAPLTLLLPIPEPLAATAGHRTLAARIPAHPQLRALLQRLGHALTATSANLSGRRPMLAAKDLTTLLGNQPAVVIDDGLLPGGPPSTLVSWPDGELRVLRPGAYPVDSLPRLLSVA